MKIVTVCGMGMGSSLILKMNIDDILAAKNIDAEVEACDLGSVTGRGADIVVTTEELGEQLKNKDLNVVLVPNVIDKQMIGEKVIQAIKSFNHQD
jgi:PTS system ascorbate-specific IIB component